MPLQAGAGEGTSSPESILHRLERIAAQARQYPDMQFTTLAHLLDVAMLERAFWSLKPDSAPGVDRVTWRNYKRNLETNLEDLHERLKSKTRRKAARKARRSRRYRLTSTCMKCWIRGSPKWLRLIVLAGWF
jgi:hypothetical protein